MGDFEEVERLQAGIRTWLLRTARSGRHELRGISAPAVLPMLGAAAFGPALADADGPAPGRARMGVLVSVGADVLAHLLEGASSRARSASADAPDLTRSPEAEISRSVREVLDAGGPGASELRSDIAMVMREIDAGGTAFRTAIEAGDEELEREVLAALESLGAQFGDMAFMLSDLARAAGEVQDSLGGQHVELRAARERAVRQSADVRMIREELAAIEQRAGQWQPEPAEPPASGPRLDGGCPYRGLLPYDQADAAVFCGRERLTAELADLLAGTGIVMITGASGAGKTSLLRAGLVPALARGVQVPGSQGWPILSLTVTARPLTDLAAGLARLDNRDPAAVRQRLADAPGQAHLLIRELIRNAARLVLIVDQFERVFAGDGAQERAERAAFADALSAATGRPGRGSRSARPGTTPAGSAPLPPRRGSPGRARRWKPPIPSPRRCSPGPRGGSRRPRRPGTACSSRWPSRCAASCPPVRARSPRSPPAQAGRPWRPPTGTARSGSGTPPRTAWSAPRPGAARRTRSRSPVTARRSR
jgi:hypothetical protein